MKTRELSRRVRTHIGCKSKCCNGNILPGDQRLYCDDCDRTLVDFSGSHRAMALRSMHWVRWWPDSISLMWRNLCVANARSVPHYEWQPGVGGDGYEEIATSYKWTIGTSNCDFSRISSALNLTPRDMDYPGRDDFPSLTAASEDLWLYLARRDPGVIRHWSTASPCPRDAIAVCERIHGAGGES